MRAWWTTTFACALLLALGWAIWPPRESTESPRASREAMVSNLMIEDAPVIFLPTLTLNLGSRTYVHGDRILSVENYPTRFAWLDKQEMARQGVRR